MMEFSGPTDKSLEDEDDRYPSEETVKRALTEEAHRTQEILKNDADRLKKLLGRPGLAISIFENLD